MTFQFGILAEIDIGVSTLALALTILFLTCFDIVTRLIEYSVRNNQIYNKMLQKMYKEVCLDNHCFVFECFLHLLSNCVYFFTS